MSTSPTNPAVSVTRWDPAAMLRATASHDARFTLLILNQALDKTLLDAVWDRASYRVAADGGANRLYDLTASDSGDRYGSSLSTIIGDLDSLRPSARDYYASLHVPIIEDPDQYSTDFTKAMIHIRTVLHQQSNPNVHPAQDVLVLGGLGGRVDQGISVLHHLYRFQSSYELGRVVLLSLEAVTFVLKKGKHSIRLRPEEGNARLADAEGPGVRGLGVNVGILPLKGKAFITTSGLEWDVQDWETEMGGNISTSNHVKEDVVEIETTEDVLFTVDLDIKT